MLHKKKKQKTKLLDPYNKGNYWKFILSFEGTRNFSEAEGVQII